MGTRLARKPGVHSYVALAGPWLVGCVCIQMKQRLQQIRNGLSSLDGEGRDQSLLKGSQPDLECMSLHACAVGTPRLGHSIGRATEDFTLGLKQFPVVHMLLPWPLCPQSLTISLARAFQLRHSPLHEKNLGCLWAVECSLLYLSAPRVSSHPL